MVGPYLSKGENPHIGTYLLLALREGGRHGGSDGPSGKLPADADLSTSSAFGTLFQLFRFQDWVSKSCWKLIFIA